LAEMEKMNCVISVENTENKLKNTKGNAWKVNITKIHTTQGNMWFTCTCIDITNTHESYRRLEVLLIHLHVYTRWCTRFLIGIWYL
jgi:hypothetical protein